MSAIITFKKVRSNGQLEISINLKKEDITVARLSKLFKVAAESLYLTTSGSSVVFPDSDGQLSHLGETDYYVNGDPSNEVQKETPLTNIINRGQPVLLQRYPIGKNATYLPTGICSQVEPCGQLQEARQRVVHQLYQAGL